MARATQEAKAVGQTTVTKNRPSRATSHASKKPSTEKLTSNVASNGVGRKASSQLLLQPKHESTASHKQQALPDRSKAPGKRRNDGVSAGRPAKRVKSDKILTSPPSQTLDIYVMGTGKYRELGLGPTTTTIKRPRLNHLLGASTVGVVQIAVGGMHCIALTQDQRILTWGVNDNGALGRDTNPTDDSDEDGLNPKESIPGAVSEEFFGLGRKTFTQVVATDSASFVLTTDGSVYGWGTFGGNDGVFGFSTADTIIAEKMNIEEKRYQRRPALIPQLSKIKFLAAGANHVQALDHTGNVFCWGTGEQSQLGRRIMERSRALVDVQGNVYTWGLNNFGQTGISTGAGENEAIVMTPRVIKNLQGFKIKEIQGGNHHSIACTEDGQVLTWGRCDDAQAGIPLQSLPKEDLVFDSRDRARILTKPTVVPDVQGDFVAAGIDNSLAINENGQVYAWGFSAGYRTGIGLDESIEKPALLDNTAVRGKKITFAGCGGQFSVLAGPSSSSFSNAD